MNVYQELLLRDFHVLHVYSECDVCVHISLSLSPQLYKNSSILSSQKKNSLILKHINVCDDMVTHAFDSIH
jgi:hypothetical protein